MTKYNFKFDFDINDRIQNLLNGEFGTVIGISYFNGKNPYNDKIYFHAVVCFIEYDNGKLDARSEDDLQKI